MATPTPTAWTASWPAWLTSNWKEQRSDLLLKAEGTTIQGAPMLSADIIGDWREEVVLPATD